MHIAQSKIQFYPLKNSLPIWKFFLHLSLSLFLFHFGTKSWCVYHFLCELFHQQQQFLHLKEQLKWWQLFASLLCLPTEFFGLVATNFSLEIFLSSFLTLFSLTPSLLFLLQKTSNSMFERGGFLVSRMIRSNKRRMWSEDAATLSSYFFLFFFSFCWYGFCVLLTFLAEGKLA